MGCNSQGKSAKSKVKVQKEETLKKDSRFAHLQKMVRETENYSLPIYLRQQGYSADAFRQSAFIRARVIVYDRQGFS